MTSSRSASSKNLFAEMIATAIGNASKLGIQMYHPFLNSANGNCAFESVIDNINSRKCFSENFSKSPDFYRSAWMIEIEKVGFHDWNMGLSKKEWEKEWSLIRNSRLYEHCLGDLIIPGIAHAVRKNILIFNTHPTANPPVFVVSASTFGGTPSTDIPVCLAYNNFHYEQLVPKSSIDIARTVKLSNKLLTGSVIDELLSFNMKEKQNLLTDYEENFPSLSSAKNVNALNKTFCTNTLSELKQIKVKDRTKEQQKQYKHLMYLQQKQQLSLDELEARKQKDRENKKINRLGLDDEKKNERKIRSKAENENIPTKSR